MPMQGKDIEQRERDAFAAVGALGQRELDAVKAWIASGCEGEQPKTDMAERDRLGAELDAAIDASRHSAIVRTIAVPHGDGLDALDDVRSNERSEQTRGTRV